MDPFIEALVRPPLRGQILVQDGGRHPNGKRLMAIVGIVAVEDNTPLKSGHQYTLVGGERTGLRLILESEIDRTKESLGMGLGNMLKEPIWRI